MLCAVVIAIVAIICGIEWYVEYAETNERGEGMLWRFNAEDLKSAGALVEKWIQYGLMPAGEYVIFRSAIRPGIFCAKRKVV